MASMTRSAVAERCSISTGVNSADGKSGTWASAPTKSRSSLRNVLPDADERPSAAVEMAPSSSGAFTSLDYRDRDRASSPMAQPSAISYQLSAISYQLSAISYQLSA